MVVDIVFRTGILVVGAGLLLGGCGGFDDLACADIVLTGGPPVAARNIDVRTDGVDGQVTVGWSATLTEDIEIALRASAGVTFTEEEMMARRISVRRGCDQEPFGSGVAGAGFARMMQLGEPIVADVTGCEGDCDVIIDFPEPTTDG